MLAGGPEEVLDLKDVAGDLKVAVAVHGCGGSSAGGVRVRGVTMNAGRSAENEGKRSTGEAGSELERYGINSCDSWNSNSEPGQRYGTHGCG
ncbi:hypothetical protein GCM10010231_64470 [Streptomyces sindenensis]|nr:hypothetical protein GCM10010231_64470 [Streptomyces sindenensis]